MKNRFILILGIVFALMTCKVNASEIEFVYGGGDVAASAKTEEQAMLFCGAYKDGVLADISIKRGNGELLSKRFSASDDAELRAFLLDGDLKPIEKCTEVITYGGVDSLKVEVADTQYTAFQSEGGDTVSFYIPYRVVDPHGGSVPFVDFGIGAAWDETLASVNMEIVENTDITNKSEKYNLAGGYSLKTDKRDISVKAYKTTLQYSTDFKEVGLSSSKITSDESKWGLPFWWNTMKGDAVWRWKGSGQDENVTTSVSGSYLFVNKKTPDAADGFYCYGCKEKYDVSAVVTEYDARFDALSGSGMYIGGRGAVMFRKNGDEIELYGNPYPDKGAEYAKKLHLAPKLSEGKWYKIKTLEEASITDDGFLIKMYVYVDGVFAGSFERLDEFGLRLKLEQLRFDSYDDTVYQLKFDNFNLSYAQNEAFRMISDELKAELKELDKLTDKSILDWLIELFDPETGAFYHSIGSRDGYMENGTKYQPCIEATEFALEILEATGVIKPSDYTDGTYPKVYAERLCNYIKGMQDEDGYFYHEMWGKDIGQTRRDRDLHYGTAILQRFGETPIYPYPGDTATLMGKSDGFATLMSGTKSTLPDYLQSEEAFKRYLDSLYWDHTAIWDTGNRLSSAASLIGKSGLGSFLREYLKGKQNPETGLWGSGEGLSIDNSNGSMKISYFFASTENPYPNIDKMVNSIISILADETQDFTSACPIWNTLQTVRNGMNSYRYPQGDMTPFKPRKAIYDAMPQMIRTVIKKAMVLKREDGGYSGHANRCATGIQGAPIAPNMLISDLDGTTIIGIRLGQSVYEILDLEFPKHFEKYRDEFYEKIKKKGALN